MHLHHSSLFCAKLLSGMVYLRKLNPRRTLRPVAGVALSTIAVTIAIALINRAADVANVSMLYLLSVIICAVLFGSSSAIVAAFAAFLAFDIFFVEPNFRLAVSDPEEWVALMLLLITGIITGQLAGGLRRKASGMEGREREAVVLYDVVRLMAEPDVRSALNAVAHRLRTELRLAAVAIEMPAEGGMVAETGDVDALEIARLSVSQPSLILSGGSDPTETSSATPGRWVKIVPPEIAGTRADNPTGRAHKVAINSEEARVGTVILVRSQPDSDFSREEDRLLSAVAGQIGQAIERAKLRDQAIESEILRRTDELRSALLNTVSHDLRTPLSSIIASAESIMQRHVQWTDEEKRDFAKTIEEEAQRLNRLVGNLLDLSRIQAGNLAPERGWYDFGSLVDEVVGRLRLLASQHRITVDVPEDLSPVYFDYVEIDAVISNLIENALKYTPPDTEVKISASQGFEELVVTVEDSGYGVPEDSITQLFEPFYRVQRSGRPKGTGLGLAVAKGIVEAHGGRIWAENRETGGAIFNFTLPLHPELAEIAEWA